MNQKKHIPKFSLTPNRLTPNSTQISFLDETLSDIVIKKQQNKKQTIISKIDNYVQRYNCRQTVQLVTTNNKKQSHSPNQIPKHILERESQQYQHNLRIESLKQKGQSLILQTNNQKLHDSYQTALIQLNETDLQLVDIQIKLRSTNNYLLKLNWESQSQIQSLQQHLQTQQTAKINKQIQINQLMAHIEELQENEKINSTLATDYLSQYSTLNHDHMLQQQAEELARLKAVLHGNLKNQNNKQALQQYQELTSQLQEINTQINELNQSIQTNQFNIQQQKVTINESQDTTNQDEQLMIQELKDLDTQIQTQSNIRDTLNKQIQEIAILTDQNTKHQEQQINEQQTQINLFSHELTTLKNSHQINPKIQSNQAQITQQKLAVDQLEAVINQIVIPQEETNNSSINLLIADNQDLEAQIRHIQLTNLNAVNPVSEHDLESLNQNLEKLLNQSKIIIKQVNDRKQQIEELKKQIVEENQIMQRRNQQFNSVDMQQVREQALAIERENKQFEKSILYPLKQDIDSLRQKHKASEEKQLQLRRQMEQQMILMDDLTMQEPEIKSKIKNLEKVLSTKK